MKAITNKYWYIHWWYLFYLLDDSSHKFAINKIWDCLTWNATIYYNKPICKEDLDKIEIKHEEIFRTNKTIIIQSKLLVDKKLYIASTFTFIKLKDGNKT